MGFNLQHVCPALLQSSLGHRVSGIHTLGLEAAIMCYLMKGCLVSEMVTAAVSEILWIDVQSPVACLLFLWIIDTAVNRRKTLPASL